MPAAVPVATGPLESASRELTLPLPVPAGVARVVELAGLVQVWVIEDFSVQELTSHELRSATATVGRGVGGGGRRSGRLGGGGHRGSEPVLR